MKRLTVKNQLRAFYARQGLTGKHLRKAIQWDMKAVRRNADWTDYDPGKDDLSCSFSWNNSPEGYYYWSNRCIMPPLEAAL